MLCQSIQANAEYARHGGDFRGRAIALAYENWPDQVIDRELMLGHHPAGCIIKAVTAQARQGEFLSKHGEKLLQLIPDGDGAERRH
ncbi:hypothetical protein AA11237_2055 [Acidocella aminolytica 101 = DSM 11237]|nr:hypothetical protein AA11237_2055 [Acidocella aminolytica 101 = DSM 11237]